MGTRPQDRLFRLAINNIFETHNTLCAVGFDKLLVASLDTATLDRLVNIREP